MGSSTHSGSSERQVGSVTDDQRAVDCSQWAYDQRLARALVVNPGDDRWADVDDDAPRSDYPDIGVELQAYINWDNRGFFDFNPYGRHVLHQLAEDFRSPRQTFSKTLWLEASKRMFLLIRSKTTDSWKDAMASSRWSRRP